MTAIAKQIISSAEYLMRERTAFEKSEYYRGEVFAMDGVTKHDKLEE